MTATMTELQNSSQKSGPYKKRHKTEIKNRRQENILVYDFFISLFSKSRLITVCELSDHPAWVSRSNHTLRYTL